MSKVSLIDRQDKYGTASRFRNNKVWNPIKRIGRKIYIEPGAQRFLDSLNGYDHQQVVKGIEALASIPIPTDGYQQTFRPNFFKAKKDPGVTGAFLIRYEVTSELVNVTAIELNLAALQPQVKSADERACLYRVKRQNNLDFNENMSLEDIDGLQRTWGGRVPTVEVATQHAAVNGMLNDLTKATWLMGAHVSFAFKSDKVAAFTLFHNPSESGPLDFYECAKDNLGLTTENAKQLAAVLADVQKKGKPVKWAVHSQGGIIFMRAVAYHLKTYGTGASLSLNSVVFHAGGNNEATTKKLLAQAGITKLAEDRNNPFDLVPAIAGRNNLQWDSLKRSKQFWGKVKGTPTSSPAESPHTLPFISLEAYQRFLVMAGDNQSADRVGAYMKKQAVGQ